MVQFPVLERKGCQHVLMLLSVIAKYAGHAGHVLQASADVRQRAQTLPDILSSSV